MRDLPLSSLFVQVLYWFGCFPMCFWLRCMCPKALDANGYVPVYVVSRNLFWLWIEPTVWQVCFGTSNLVHQIVNRAYQRGVASQTASVCCCWCWSVDFCLWVLFSSSSRGSVRCITCVIYMWLSRDVSWICQMCWWKCSVRHSFVRWSTDFYRWVLRCCLRLFLLAKWTVASDCCPGDDNLWDVNVGKCRCCIFGVGLNCFLLELVVIYVVG